MNTSFETIKSLIGLLVKKSGFDLNDTYSENELDKTIELTKKYNSNDDFLSELNIRKNSWENNAEVLGKKILEAYSSNKTFESVKDKLDSLSILASKNENTDKDSSLMGYVYNTIRKLEDQKIEIEQKIEANNYVDRESKNIDEELKKFLETEINDSKNEVEVVEKEIERITKIVEKNENVSSHFKKYIASVKENILKLDKAKEEIEKKDIKVEVWEKLKLTEVNLYKEKEKTKNMILNLDKSIKILKTNISEYNERKNELNKSIDENQLLLNEVNEKLDTFDYINHTEASVDANKLELIDYNLKRFKNKKEVIYVDVESVKKEIIAEWNKNKKSFSYEASVPEEKVEIKEEAIEKIEKPKEEQKLIEEKKEETIEFDW